MNNEKNPLLTDLNPDDYVVVDLDTGTVLGTNLQVVKVSHLSMEEQDEIFEAGDSEVFEYASENGKPLFVSDELLRDAE